MEFLKTRLITIFSFNLLLLPLGVSSHEFDPLNKISPEVIELNELFRYPMLAIRGLLHSTEQYCNRMPLEKEFSDFILNGRHEFLRCSQVIKASIPLLRTGDQIGKNLPHLHEFLKRNQYKVYSDTKKIFVILKHKPIEWNYKHFKSNDYEFVIQCTFGMVKCSMSSLDLQARSCRANKTFAKDFCYFGDKKVIDY